MFSNLLIFAHLTCRKYHYSCKVYVFFISEENNLSIWLSHFYFLYSELSLLMLCLLFLKIFFFFSNLFIKEMNSLLISNYFFLKFSFSIWTFTYVGRNLLSFRLSDFLLSSECPWSVWDVFLIPTENFHGCRFSVCVLMWLFIMLSYLEYI